MNRTQTILTLMLATLWLTNAAHASASRIERKQSRSVVLVELFTSEGCSSCPPADRVLAQLISRQPINGVEVVGLSEHVDYWNSLGWKDPFSSAQFSTRQEQYERNLGLNGSYTPQMVVDGASELLGSDGDRAVQVIAAAAAKPKAHISLSVNHASETSDSLSVDVSGTPQGCGLYLAVTEDGLSSQVARGENSGHRLSHSAVVRQLTRIGQAPSSQAFHLQIPINLNPNWKKKSLRYVVFAQPSRQGRVLGASEIAE